MKINAPVIFSLFISGALLLPLRADAQAKLATVDLGKVLTEAPGAKIEREEIDKKVEAAREKIEDKQKALADLQEKIADSKDAKELDKFDKERKELERFIQDSREDIGRQIDQTGKTLTGKALSLISAYAKQNGIDLVLDKSSHMRNPLLFGEASIDITDKIIEQME